MGLPIKFEIFAPTLGFSRSLAEFLRADKSLLFIEESNVLGQAAVLQLLFDLAPQDQVTISVYPPRCNSDRNQELPPEADKPCGTERAESSAREGTGERPLPLLRTTGGAIGERPHTFDT